jgi:peptide deformylase
MCPTETSWNIERAKIWSMADHNADADRLELEQRFAGIRQWGDPVLTSPARSVDRFDSALAAQAQQMIEIMDRAGGIGLAAPQVGITQRLITYYRDREADEPSVLVNPSIVGASEETTLGLEGCLSIGCSTIAVRVERAAAVTVRASTPDGGDVEIAADGTHARVLQHEIDHLDGILMLDRVDAEQRRCALRALRLGKSWAPPPVDETD